MAIKVKWHNRRGITSIESINRMVADANKCAPNIAGFDTEASGLHIVNDIPFLLQFGFANSRTLQGYVYYLDLERHPEIADVAVQTMWQIAELALLNVGHNIKFDLHMMHNVEKPYLGNNLADTQVMIRLACDAIPVKKGGPPLALKLFTAKYIDKNARFHEEELNNEKTKLAEQYNTGLKKILKENGFNWGPAKDYLKNELFEINDLGEDFSRAYYAWYNTLPEKIRFNMKKHYVSKDDIPYNMLDREKVYIYGVYDVIYTIEIAILLLPVLKVRKQMTIFKQECDLIRPLFEMEREGFVINFDYIHEVKPKLRNYILKRQKDLEILAGEPLKASQNKRIAEVLKERFNLTVESTGKEVFQDLVSLYEDDEDNKNLYEFIKTIQELRTLEKWYTTYLIRFVKESKISDRAYTQIKQAGPVTGRVSSDFQQFPKDFITDNEGNEIFDPRKMVKVADEDDGIAYIDFSQIELRFQAAYTILIGHPDLNLCRAYMPYQCFRMENGQRIDFDYDNKEHISTCYGYTWFKNEDSTEWEPTDVHLATTIKAFPELDDDEKEFMGHNRKYWRGKIGKSTNFAKNYGAQRKKIKEMFAKFKFDDEKLTQIDNAYYEAFPGVKEYHSYCYNIASNGFMTNMFSRRYYGISGHNGINALVQGSSADFLKEKIILLNKYIKEKGLKSRMVMNIHDEIQFVIRNQEWSEIWEFQRIMQEFPELPVPIVADLEVTKTVWSAKEEISNVSDIDAINRG